MRIKQKIDNTEKLVLLSVFVLDIFFHVVRKIYRKKIKPDGVDVIIALHKLGDTVFTIPAILQFLNQKKTSTIIICFSHSEVIYRKVLKEVKYLNFDSNDFMFNGRIATKEARNKLNSFPINLVIDLKGSIVSGSLIFNTKCNKIYGMNEIYFRKIYDIMSPIRTTPHQIDLYFDAVITALPSIKNNFKGYPINFSTNGWILIQPFAGWPGKEWNFNKFIKLYHKLSTSYKSSIVYTPKSIDPDIISELKLENIQLICSDKIEYFIEILKDCRLFISNDSGPLQIAAMLGIPTFTIYGPTNPDFHSPLGSHHRNVRKLLKCTPMREKLCFAEGGDTCPHHDCMALLSVEDVYFSVVEFLKELEDKFIRKSLIG